MTPISLVPLFTIKAEVTAPPQLVGAVPHGYTRRVMVVSGGHFEGERLSGKVLPGGADVVLERPDGGLHLDVRLVLETTQFETAAPRLAWLNDKVAVGTGTREPDGPIYDVWEVA
jgi:hypothetical protein